MSYGEIWKKYDDNYLVSDLGRVKRIYKNGNEHYLQYVPRSKTDRQLRVKIYHNYVPIRRLVWTIFRGEIPDGYAVVNKNGCHTMNELYNLMLMPMNVSKSLNRFSRRKPIIDLDTGNVYASSRIAAKHLFLTKTAVLDYCHGKINNPIYRLKFFDETENYRRVLTFIKS